jgi:hypothetical protein
MSFIGKSVLLVLCGAALLAGCARCIKPKDLTYQVLRLDNLVEGVKGRVKLEVVNDSTKYMLLDEVGQGQLADGPKAMIEAKQGALTTAADGGSCSYNWIAQQETDAVFSHALIPPGQRVELELELLPVVGTGLFRVTYRALTAEEVTELIFLPMSEPAGVGQEFRKATLAEVEEASGTPEDETGRHPIFKLVVTDRDLLKKPAKCKVDLPYRVAVEAAPMTVDLERVLGGKPSWQAYSYALEGWIAGTEGGVKLVKGEAASALPDSPPALYSDIDRKEAVRVKVGDEGNAMTKGDPKLGAGLQFLDNFGPLSPGDGKFTVGAFVEVHKRNVGRFLELLRANGCALLLQYFYMDSYYFEARCGK